ncbi:hypothetical protein PM8797T_31478 [Gimesia maris DSM 8797]|uniref:Transposase n=1 Tax=Gimesia maris TaxID=122 RepID=A0ABX5YM82_9PLAN|nr:hypothetical protein PM8797T_31478 [Gimesia maris DSM 8797]QEG16707.1 hypothetical protein GmarT_25740 [Gimesia maris]
MGITELICYRWNKKYVGLGVAEVSRLKELEEESRKLKQLMVDLNLEKSSSRTFSKKTVKPARHRALIQELQVIVNSGISHDHPMIRLKSDVGFKKRYLDSDSPSRVIRLGLSANQMLSVCRGRHTTRM